MLTAHWGAVEALAAELIVHRRIDGEQVEEIIDHAMPRVGGAQANRAGDQPLAGGSGADAGRRLIKLEDAAAHLAVVA